MINRREFISAALLMFFSSSTYGAYEVLLRNPQKGYYSNLMARFFNWYNKEFYNFTNKFTSAEINYIVSVLKQTHSLRWQNAQGVSYKKLYWSARIQNNNLSYARFALGFEPENVEAKKIVHLLIEQKKITDTAGLSKQDICGLGWDFDNNVFKIYFYVDKSKIKNIISGLRTPPNLENIPSNTLVSLKYAKGKIIEQRLCVPVKEHLTSDQKSKILNFEYTTQIMGHYSNKRDPVYIPDYIGINFMRLPKPLSEFCQKIMDNFATGPTTGVINHYENLSLYYP